MSTSLRTGFWSQFPLLLAAAPWASHVTSSPMIPSSVKSGSDEYSTLISVIATHRIVVRIKGNSVLETVI